MSLCLSVLVIMLLNYSKITTNAKCNKMVTLTRYYNYILHTCILPILTEWYIPRFRRSAAQVQCIIVNCGTFTNMPSLAALEQPFQAAISSPRNPYLTFARWWQHCLCIALPSGLAPAPLITLVKSQAGPISGSYGQALSGSEPIESYCRPRGNPGGGFWVQRHADRTI